MSCLSFQGKRAKSSSLPEQQSKQRHRDLWFYCHSRIPGGSLSKNRTLRLLGAELEFAIIRQDFVRQLQSAFFYNNLIPEKKVLSGRPLRWAWRRRRLYRSCWSFISKSNWRRTYFPWKTYFSSSSVDWAFEKWSCFFNNWFFSNRNQKDKCYISTDITNENSSFVDNGYFRSIIFLVKSDVHHFFGQRSDFECHDCSRTTQGQDQRHTFQV